MVAPSGAVLHCNRRHLHAVGERFHFQEEFPENDDVTDTKAQPTMSDADFDAASSPAVLEPPLITQTKLTTSLMPPQISSLGLVALSP